MKERITYLMKDLDLGTSGLSELTGIKPSSISHVLSGRNKPGFEFIQKVLHAIPELNARWFMTGEGEMYASTQQRVSNPPTQNGENDLFSNVNTETPTHLSPRESNISKQAKPLVKKDDSKGRDSEKKVDKQDIAKGISSLERIVFFYTDGSFKEYQPGN